MIQILQMALSAIYVLSPVDIIPEGKSLMNSFYF